MEDLAVAARLEALRRSGQRGDRPRRGMRRPERRRRRGASRVRRGEGHRSHRRRTRDAARGRDRRSLLGARPRDLRLWPRGGEARGEQGLGEGVHAPPWNSDGRLHRVRRRGRRARVDRAGRAALRHEGRRARRRQGRHHREDARGSAGSGLPRDAEKGVRGGGEPSRRRRVPRGARGVDPLRIRRLDVSSLRAVAGSQTRAGRRSRPQHGRHGRVRAGAGALAGYARAHPRRDHRADVRGHAVGRHRRRRRSLLRSHARRGRAEGARI